MCKSRSWLAALAVLAVSVLLTACGGGGGSTADAGGEHGGGQDHAAQASVHDPVDGAPEVTLTATDIDYAPATLELTAGEPTNVTIVNDGETLHDFTLEEADVHANVEPGESVTTSVTIDEAGTYQAVCTVAGHAEAGMTIEVVVS